MENVATQIIQDFILEINKKLDDKIKEAISNKGIVLSDNYGDFTVIIPSDGLNYLYYKESTLVCVWSNFETEGFTATFKFATS